MDPLMIGIILVCIAVVIFGPIVATEAAPFVVAFGRALVELVQRVLLSSRDAWQRRESARDRAPVTIPTAVEQPIATPNNEYSSPLSDNRQRDFETTAKTIATLYEKGIVTNLSKAICAAYGCTVQAATKPDSTYQLALRAVNRNLSKAKGGQFVQADGTLGPATHPITGK